MVNPFLSLYRTIVVYFIINLRSSWQPYASIIWMARLVFTLTLPLTLPIFFFKVTKRFITNKDLEESLQEKQKLLAIYRETSEYEYRSTGEVFVRIWKTIPKRQIGEHAYELEDEPIPQQEILAMFILQAGVLFTLRLEDRDEFVNRRYEEYRQSLRAKTKTNNVEISESDKIAVKDAFGKQFDIISAKSGEDMLKGLYLGREILAAKINIGKKRNPPPYREVPAL